MLDTDIIIGILRNTPDALSAYERYKDERIIVSSFTWYELMVGCDPAKHKGQLAAVVACLEGAGIMHIDDTVSTMAARFALLLEKRGRQIGMADRFIAASCVVNGETLVTRNVKHFKDIPGLKVESW